MKTLYILFIGLLVSGGVMAQSCLPEGIIFTTQAQIDSFQIIYPNCTEIEGDVTIGENYVITDITNLNGLSVLNSIGGSLIIGGSYPWVNPVLISLSGLDNVTSVGGNLWIRENAALTSLTGLDNVTSIGGWLSIFNNVLLTNLIGLDNVTSIGGGVQISSHNALTSLSGLESLTSIGGGLHISGNLALTSLSGLDNVTSIGGKLYIYYNNALTSLSGLENIDAGSITNLYIHENNTLSTCEVQSICDYLVSPNGAVGIHSNASGCNNPVEVANACGFTLSCLPYGNYYFLSQADIDNFQTYYPNCTELEGSVTIEGDDIANLNGLNIVTTIGGDIMMHHNDALTSLSGLDNVTSIGGKLYIYYNNALTSLSGLENLTSIGGELRVWGNSVLISLMGIDNIDAGSIFHLTIRENYALFTCEVQSICDYLANPSGDINIWNNATGCNSPEEVQDSCIANGVNIDEQLIAEKVLFYPNPSSNQITIELPTTPHKNTSLTIYNLSGQQLITQPITEPQTVVDVSGLPSGVYFLKVVDDKKVMMGKVVVE